MTTGKSTYKKQYLQESIDWYKAAIPEARALLRRIMTGEQVQMYTIGGRSLQNYQLTPKGLQELIKEWETALFEDMAALDGTKKRRAFTVVTGD